MYYPGISLKGLQKIMKNFWISGPFSDTVTPTKSVTMLKYLLLYQKYQLPNAANVLHMMVV
jgi:hypothetical protein